MADVTSASAANAAPGGSSRGKPPATASLLVPSTLERVSAELRRRVGDTSSALMLEVTPQHATIQVEAPTRRGSVVQYEWADGTLRGPVPVELRGPGTLETNLFPLSSVDLTELPTLAKTAIERIDKENGELERIVVRRNLPVEETVGIRVYVKSPVRSSHVDADVRGRIVETSRLP